MVHDHDLCCPRRHKYYRVTGKICRQRMHLRCWLDLAFLERGGRLGVTYSPVLPKLNELRRQRSLERLLVASQFMRQELLVNGAPAAKIEVLPPVTPAWPGSATGPSEEPLVLYVEQLVRGKGVDPLLKALARLSCPWEALLVGEGNERAALESLAARLGLAGRVRFAGWTPPRELGAYYGRARLLVVPSRWPEPFGMMGIEAMQRGLPVAGFAVGVIADWLRHGLNGLACPEQDVDSLARALHQLLTDQNLARRLGEQGLALARAEYGFTAYMDRLEVILAGGGRCSASEEGAPCESA